MNPPETAPKNVVEDRGVPTALRQLWIKFRPEMQRRVACIESAADAITAGSSTAEQRESAEQAAHKLAGSLGIFGFAQGTEIARRLETLFADAAESPDATELRAMAQALRAMVAEQYPSSATDPQANPQDQT